MVRFMSRLCTVLVAPFARWGLEGLVRAEFRVVGVEKKSCVLDAAQRLPIGDFPWSTLTLLQNAINSDEGLRCVP